MHDHGTIALYSTGKCDGGYMYNLSVVICASGYHIQLAKILLLPSKNEIINVMLFCKMITFSHHKTWCQHMV